MEFRQDKSSVSTVNGIEDPFQAPDSYPFAAVEYLVLFAEYEDDGQIGIYANRLLEPGRAIDKHVYKRSHPWPTCNNVENIQRAIKPPSYDFENLAPVMPFKSNQVMEILELLETKKTDDKRTQLANSPTPTTRTKGTPRRDMGAALVRRAQTDGELPKLASRTTSSKTPLQSNKRKSATDENSRSTKRSASKSNSDETVETRNKTKIRTLVWSSLLKRDYDKGAEKTKLLYQIIKGGIQYIFVSKHSLSLPLQTMTRIVLTCNIREKISRMKLLTSKECSKPLIITLTFTNVWKDSRVLTAIPLGTCSIHTFCLTSCSVINTKMIDFLFSLFSPVYHLHIPSITLVLFFPFLLYILAYRRKDLSFSFSSCMIPKLEISKVWRQHT